MSDEMIAVKFGFRTSPEIGEIALSLVAAQAEFGAAVKDSANPAYRSKYADLSSCIEATQKALSKHGIAVMQAPQLDGQMVTITTRLQHKSGQWYESDLTLPAVQRERFDAQSVGSAITYGRRYSLQSILNLATADDDGNSASGVGTHEQAQAVGKKKVAELKAAKANGETHKCLFFVLPEAFNGNTAELVNVKAFGETLNEVAAEGLRVILKKYVRLGKQNGELYLNSEKLPLLMDELKECGVELRELQTP